MKLNQSIAALTDKIREFRPAKTEAIAARLAQAQRRIVEIDTQISGMQSKKATSAAAFIESGQVVVDLEAERAIPRLMHEQTELRHLMRELQGLTVSTQLREADQFLSEVNLAAIAEQCREALAQKLDDLLTLVDAIQPLEQAAGQTGAGGSPTRWLGLRADMPAAIAAWRLDLGGIDNRQHIARLETMCGRRGESLDALREAAQAAEQKQIALRQHAGLSSWRLQ